MADDLGRVLGQLEEAAKALKEAVIRIEAAVGEMRADSHRCLQERLLREKEILDSVGRIRILLAATVVALAATGAPAAVALVRAAIP